MFDGSQGQGSQSSGSTSCSYLSQASTSWGHVSLAYEAPEAYEGIKEEPTADTDAFVDSYPGGPYDTFLLHLYEDHVSRHV